MTITIEIDLDEAKLLMALRAGGEPLSATRVEDVVEQLVAHAIDGVRRPGAWERGWVEQCFGAVDESLLKSDPKASWSMVPK